MAPLTEAAWYFDALTALGLVALAWRLLACADLFRAIVLFIAFGLLMALAWVRLGAPDVALAEAAIGAGVTGALLMAALARLPAAPQKDAAGSAPEAAAPDHDHRSRGPGSGGDGSPS